MPIRKKRCGCSAPCKCPRRRHIPAGIALRRRRSSRSCFDPIAQGLQRPVVAIVASSSAVRERLDQAGITQYRQVLHDCPSRQPRPALGKLDRGQSRLTPKVEPDCAPRRIGQRVEAAVERVIDGCHVTERSHEFGGVSIRTTALRVQGAHARRKPRPIPSADDGSIGARKPRGSLDNTNRGHRRGPGRCNDGLCASPNRHRGRDRAARREPDTCGRRGDGPCTRDAVRTAVTHRSSARRPRWSERPSNWRSKPDATVSQRRM